MEVKEAPARGLRAVFAGFGRALGGRRKGGPPAAEAKAAGDSGHVKVVAPEAADVETVAAETPAPETVAEAVTPQTVAETITPEAEPQAAAAETVAVDTEAATPATEASDALPLANYDTLTVASLRA